MHAGVTEAVHTHSEYVILLAFPTDVTLTPRCVTFICAWLLFFFLRIVLQFMTGCSEALNLMATDFFFPNFSTFCI